MSPEDPIPTVGLVEIRIVLDRAEPPRGRLRIVPGGGHDQHSEHEEEIPFTGWLGLLRALYVVTGSMRQ